MFNYGGMIRNDVESLSTWFVCNMHVFNCGGMMSTWFVCDMHVEHALFATCMSWIMPHACLKLCNMHVNYATCISEWCWHAFFLQHACWRVNQISSERFPAGKNDRYNALPGLPPAGMAGMGIPIPANELARQRARMTWPSMPSFTDQIRLQAAGRSLAKPPRRCLSFPLKNSNSRKI